MASSLLLVALVSGTGVIALTQLREDGPRVGGQITSPAASQSATAEPTESAAPTASPTRTPRATPRSTPRATPRPTATPQLTPVPPATSPTWIYVVRDFDSISGIAEHYGTTTETLLNLNPQYRANPDHIEEGDTVEVPCTSVARAEGRCP